MNYVSANNEYHVPLHLNPSNRRRCYRCKDNYYFEVLQIGDLLLRRESWIFNLNIQKLK